MNDFESKAKQEFGISCTEAVAKHIIFKGLKQNKKGEWVTGDWTHSEGGDGTHNFKTQYEALESYFWCIKERDKGFDEEESAKINLFRKHEEEIEKLGFPTSLTTTIRAARQSIFDLEDKVETENLNPEFVDAYEGFLLLIKKENFKKK